MPSGVGISPQIGQRRRVQHDSGGAIVVAIDRSLSRELSEINSGLNFSSNTDS